MIIKGTAYKFADNINTDAIISGRYKFAISDINELAKHIMEDIYPDFNKKIQPKDSIIVAGDNFGMGSSREQAPLALKAAGINAVVAKSFARIFYRNSFNVGLPLIETDTKSISDGDRLEIDMKRGNLRNLSKMKNHSIQPFPDFIQKLIYDGGIVNHYKKYHKINL